MIRSKSMVRSLSSLALPGVLALTVCAGCRREEEPEYPATEPYPPGAPEEEETPSTAPQTPGVAPGAPGMAPGAQTQDPDAAVLTVVGVDIDTRLAEMCGLPGTNVFFKFDSTRLGPEAKDRLQQIATCVTTGGARGQDLVLVGHADPRGPDEYNQRLGMSRAEAVARHLRSLGVPQARVEMESKGAETAMKEPMGWPLERRVTIRLMHKP